MVAKNDLSPRIHRGERNANRSACIVASSPLKNADDSPFAIEPSMIDGALERDDQLLTGQDGEFGLDEHSAGRKVDDLAADEAEVAQSYDFAKGPRGASFSGVRALSMKHGTHLRIVWTTRSTGQETAQHSISAAWGSRRHEM